MRKLTKKWLIENSACISGILWFDRTYPDGLILTKNNMAKAINKLIKYHNRDKRSASIDLNWFIRMTSGRNDFYRRIGNLNWDKIKKKAMIECTWKDLLDIRKANKQ